jgi:hypothetical protein
MAWSLRCRASAEANVECLWREQARVVDDAFGQDLRHQ